MPSERAKEDLAIDLTRLAFYKHYFGKLLIALVISMILNGLLLLAFVIVKNHRVEREYFAVDSQTGRMTPIVPISEPYITDSSLLTWAVECVTNANKYDFVNYQQQFQKNAECFTDDGWSQFMTAMDHAGTLDTVKSQRLVVSSVATGAAVITRTGIVRGAYSWEIQMPITVTYQGGQAGRTMISQKLLVTLRVSRVPTYQSKYGVGIAQYVAEEKNS